MDIKSLKIMSLACALAYSSSGYSNSLFPNSVASNDIDFILATDPSVLAKLEFVGNSRQELPDKRTDVLFDDNAYVFHASYADDTSIKIFASSAFINLEEATRYAEMLLKPVGKLPFKMREKLAHIVVLKGNETAFAEDKGHFFAVYSKNMDIRSGNNDLEETVFHESVHATLDESYSNSERWLSAQQSDNIFITNYAERNPRKEDLAESALFAYTYLRNPDRLPPHVKIWLEKMMPNRLAFFEKLFQDQY